MALYLCEAGIAKQVLYGLRLVVAVFEQQPTVGLKVLACLANDQTQVVQAIVA